MLKSDVENAQELAQLLFDLTQNEGESVVIYHPNPEFDGPNSMVCVSTDHFNSKCYPGESVLDCLRQAHANAKR